MSYIAINQAIKEAGGKERLVFGFGRFYFVDGEASTFAVNTVDVPKVESLTVAEWVEAWGKLHAVRRPRRVQAAITG